MAVKAVLRNHGALYTHFSQCATSDRSGKEKSKFSGLAKKLQTWSFVAEACMLKDALRCLKQLSLYLQSRKATIINVLPHVDDTTEKMQAFKTENGQTLHKFLSCYQRDQHFHNVEIVKKDGDEEQFQSKRSQFFQALHDNIQQHFPSTDLLQAASCLNQSFWPSEPIKKALFGEAQIATLCRSLHYSPSTTADIVLSIQL